MRKEGLENLTPKGHIACKGVSYISRPTTGDELMRIEGRTVFGRKSKETNITKSCKGQEIVENDYRQHPKWTWHIGVCLMFYIRSGTEMFSTRRDSPNNEFERDQISEFLERLHDCPRTFLRPLVHVQVYLKEKRNNVSSAACIDKSFK